MFIDASAIVAVLAHENDRDMLMEKMRGELLRTSAISLFEATLALVRIYEISHAEATKMANLFMSETEAQLIPIDDTIGWEAVACHERFGRGRHRAALNMGDCFSYACAKVHGLTLLCKGDDFIHTDAAVI